jgi:cysteine desulfurase/selenocysteine lyase
MNSELRALFPVTKSANYLNHAAVSAPPIVTINAIQKYLADVSQNGSVNFRDWLKTKERTRGLLAGLLGARPEQVAFMRNTSDGLSPLPMA